MNVNPASVLIRISGLILVLSTLFWVNSARAEGSWQMGLFEGLSNRQPLYETNADAGRNVLRVDIVNPGEVINVLACGTNNNDSIRVLMYDPAGALVYKSTDTANVDCDDDFTGNFDPAEVNAHQHVTDTTGIYEVHFTNRDGTILERFDVTVTNSVTEFNNTTPDDLVDRLIVSGTVFEDNGAAATPHDGEQSGAEAALAGVVLELRDSSDALLDTATTDSTGVYIISLPISRLGEELKIESLPVAGYQSVSEAYSDTTDANVADGAVSFTVTANSVEIDFGTIKTPQWVSNTIVENNPGSIAFHSHSFRAASQGSLQFSYADSSGATDNTQFNAALYLDENCNGVVDHSDIAMPVSLSVVAGQRVCVVSKVYIPASAANDDTYTTAITASISYSDPVNSGHAVTNSLQVTDVTRVIEAGQGVLVLDKAVQNLTAAGAVTTTNTAAPGDILSYSIDFRNSGTGPVTEVLIADSTPAFAVLEAPVQCPASMPDGISDCEVTLPAPSDNSAGYTGPIQWLFSGRLSAGAQSRVGFRIRVE